MSEADDERPSTRLRESRTRPVVYALGGLDPSGGAGILMDARAIGASGAHPAALATALTVQSTLGCVDVAPVDAELFRAQLMHLGEAQPPAVVKLGALGSGEVAQVVAQFLATCTCPVVVDPVAFASVVPGEQAGRPLANDDARAVLTQAIVPRGVILFANGPELARLAGTAVVDAESAAAAARVLLAQGARAVYAKGGHWPTEDSSDVVVFADACHVLPAPRLDAADVHGTGCALASLFAGRLAVLGDADDARVLAAARWAKGVLFRALEAPVVVGEGQRVVRVEQG